MATGRERFAFEWLQRASAVARARPFAVLRFSTSTAAARTRQSGVACSTADRLPVAAVTRSDHASFKIGTISKAMAAYLKEANDRSVTIANEMEKYELGKRHLANMMGMDADAMTQDDINSAIEYLFPSGLFARCARPVMKHPDQLFPKLKKAEFGMDGRPFHTMFYTRFPCFYEVMFECAEKVEALQRFEDKEVERGRKKPTDEALSLVGTMPMSLEELQDVLLEKIDQSQYQHFTAAMKHLIAQTYSYKEKEFIMRFRVSVSPAVMQIGDVDKPEIFHDSSGREGVKTVGYRRRRSAEVVLLTNGSGQITIDGCGVDQLLDQRSREVILTPFTLLHCLGKYDVQATTSGGGESSKAGAIRHGISLALCAFIDDADKEKLRLAGLLSRDYRRHERKKVGQPGARKKWTWKKR